MIVEAEYKIVDGNKVAVVDTVNGLLRKGWVVIGHAEVVYTGYEHKYSQTMIRHGKPSVGCCGVVGKEAW